MRRTIFYLLSLFLLLPGAGNLQGQAGEDEAIIGIWLKPGEKEDPSFRWKAAWIWLPKSEESHVMLARKTFTALEGIEQALLRISASDRYQLYINGNYACMGPARSAAHHQSYDILDVSGLLKSGENTIAIRVHQQEGKQWHQYQGRGGLLVQLNLGASDHNEIITSNDTWKVSKDPSWSDEAPRISRFQDFVNDRLDFRKYFLNWESPAFDDQGWDQAQELFRNSDWPAVQKNATPGALTVPWTQLVPRDLPYLEETDIRAEHLLIATEIKDPGTQKPIREIKAIPLETAKKIQIKSIQRSLKKGTSITVPPGEKDHARVLIFDFGEVVIGMPRLIVEGEEGSIIDIMSAPYILENTFTHKIVATDCLDRIILSGNQDAWEATYFKPTRYMAVAIRGTAEELVFHYAGIHRIAYPFGVQSKIEASGDPWIEQYWDASMKTLRVCTTDGYTDNYRERRQYAQTGYYAALGNYWTFGDHSLQRRYLIQVAQEQMANGIMPAYAPLSGSDYMVIFDSNCLWIRSLRNYLLYSGDHETVKELLPAALKLMELMHSFTDQNGLINDPPYAYWLDHAVMDRRGANFNLNAHYLGALEDFDEVLDWLDENGGENYSQRAERIREAMQLMWDPDRRLFCDALVDGERSSMFSEHSNAMAMALNIASEEQASSIAEEILAEDEHNYILRESGLVMVTPAMSYFLHKGLCEYGLVEESFDLFQSRFDMMLSEEGNQTLWEEWHIDGSGRTGKLQKKTRSDAQTESAFPPALICEYLFGIEVLSPGMKNIRIRPVLSGVKELSGEFPTPQGTLSLAWKFKENGEGSLQVEVPGEMKVLIDLTELEQITEKAVSLNGKEINFTTGEEAQVEINKGKYELKF